MKKLGILVSIVVSLAVPARAQVNLPIGPALQFDAHSIAASGFTPGATVIFFVVAVETVDGESVVHRWYRSVQDADGDGVVTFTAQRTLPTEIVCAAVDAASGAYAVGAPPQAVVAVVSPVNAWLHKRGTVIDQFSFSGLQTAVLYVDPGHGAWTWWGNDGASGDADGRNGATTLTLSQGESVTAGTAAPPAEFAVGSVFVAVDWRLMRVLALRVDEATLGAAE